MTDTCKMYSSIVSKLQNTCQQIGGFSFQMIEKRAFDKISYELTFI